jgi:hypothetical protein
MKLNKKTTANSAKAESKTNNKNTTVKKANVKAKKAAKAAKVRGFKAVSRVYGAFSEMDKEAYHGIQGELTLANLRKGEVKRIDARLLGNDCAVVRGKYGIGAIVGKLVTIDGCKAIQSGHFALKLDGLKVEWQGTFGALAKYIGTKGTAHKGQRKDGKKFTRAMGIGEAYGMAVDNGGKVIRLEDNTSGACAAKFGYSLA